MIFSMHIHADDIGNLREVTKAKFFEVIGPRDVHPSIQPGRYPYASIWQTPQRQALGKSVGLMEGGRELTKWYLLDAICITRDDRRAK